MPQVLQDAQRGARVELRQRVVGDDQVPLVLGEGGRHSFGGVDARVLDGKADACKLAQQQLGVILRILDKECSQRSFHSIHTVWLFTSLTIVPREVPRADTQSPSPLITHRG